MNKKVAWGVLGVANIAVKKVLPAMQRGEWCQIAAIASRDLQKAERAAKELGIGKAYGSYEELLADPEIEAVYNPLPNHLHVPWSIKAAEAGKHVLCEKPISLTVPEAVLLLRTRDRTGVKIEEAFMVRTHPQWVKAIDLVRTGKEPSALQLDESRGDEQELGGRVEVDVGNEQSLLTIWLIAEQRSIGPHYGRGRLRPCAGTVYRCEIAGVFGRAAQGRLLME